MRYCIVTTSGVAPENERTGFFQWAKAFQGPVLTREAFLEEQAKRPFHFIHIACKEEEYGLVKFFCEYKRKNIIRIIISVRKPLPDMPGFITRWKELLREADIVLGGDHSVCKDLFLKTGVKAFELAPPVDYIYYTENLPASSERSCFTIIVKEAGAARPFLKGIKGLLRLRYKLQYIDPDVPEKALWEALTKSHIVLVPEDISDGGKIAVLAALAGCIVVANADYDAARTLFPFTVFPASVVSRMRNILWGVLLSKGLRSHIIETAQTAARSFSPVNKRDQLIHVFQYRLPGFCDRRKVTVQNKIDFSIQDAIIHYYGPQEIIYGMNECIVICLLKDGEEHLPAFLRHYRKLGCMHFVFIDNGSQDNTLALLTAQKDVTVYRTDLPHRLYEIEIRRLIVEKHGKYRWCLLADIDELFDYPLSECVLLSDLLHYLRRNGYNALVAHMLDMYNSTGKTIERQGSIDLKRSFPDYDISNIRKTSYFDPWNIAYNRHNHLSDPAIQSYWGGIRKTIFKGIKHDNILTKHPLIFLDGNLRPVTNAHFSDNAVVADVTGVLYHYKFVPSFAAKVRQVHKNRSYVRFAQSEYDAYYRFLKSNTSFRIKTPATRRLGNIQDLVDNKFLYVSERYRTLAARVNDRLVSLIDPGSIG